MISPAPIELRRARPLLGTLVEITARGECEAELTRAIDAAFAAMARVHRLMSFHERNSDARARQSPGSSRRGARPPMDVECAGDCAASVVLDRRCLRHHCRPGNWCAWATCRPRIQSGLTPEPAGVTCICSPGGACASRVVCLSILAESPRASPWIAQWTACEPTESAPDWSTLAAICEPSARLPGGFTCVTRPTQAGSSLLPTFASGALATSAGYFARRIQRGKAVTPVIDGGRRTATNATFSASVSASNCMLADALTKLVLLRGPRAHGLVRRLGGQAFILSASAPAPELRRAA